MIKLFTRDEYSNKGELRSKIIKMINEVNVLKQKDPDNQDKYERIIMELESVLDQLR